MAAFDFQRLDVYQAAIEFTAVAYSIGENLPRGNAHMIDQLQRAAASIALNIAEGAGERKRAEKIRFYRIARRSTFECAAILDVLVAGRLSDAEKARNGRELLERIGAMLTRLSGAGRARGRRADSDSDSDSDAGIRDSDSDSLSDSDSGSGKDGQ